MPSPMNPGRSSYYIPENLEWVKLQEIPTRKFKCYFCDSEVASKEGYQMLDSYSTVKSYGVYICPKCNSPTFFDRLRSQNPKPIFGESLSYLPTNVELLYNEARRCYGINAYTSTVTICRSLLAYVAVDKGADKGQSFKFYVDYLQSENWLSKGTYKWVDEIRNLGNSASHDLVIMQDRDASLILRFTTGLLRNIYEFPSLLDE